MFAKLAQFAKDEDGATAIEYGLIAALVSVAAIGALTAMGQSLSTMFGTRLRPRLTPPSPAAERGARVRRRQRNGSAITGVPKRSETGADTQPMTEIY